MSRAPLTDDADLILVLEESAEIVRTAIRVEGRISPSEQLALVLDQAALRLRVLTGKGRMQ